MGRRDRAILLVSALTLLLVACQQPEGGAAGSVQSQPLTQTLPKRSGDTALGRQALIAGDIGVAKTAFSAALRKDPSDAQAALGLAEAHLALNEVQAARQIFQALAAKAPSLSARVNQGLGLIALRSGRADQAVTLLGKSVQQDDSLWRAWLGLGQAHDRLKQPSAARRSFAAAERVAPARAPVLNDLGMSYVSQKQPQRALEFFERALAMDPNYEIARGNIRIAKAMTGQYEDAISGTPETQLPDVLNNVGYIAILNKDFQVADRYLRRAIDLSAVYHKAAVANLDLLARMAGQALTSRKTAEAGADDTAQFVLAPAAPDPDPQTEGQAIETADIAPPDRQFDAIAAAATQRARSAEELAALSTPVVQSLETEAKRAPIRSDAGQSGNRAFKWEKPPLPLREDTEAESKTEPTNSEAQSENTDRTFNWVDQTPVSEIETADIPAPETEKPNTADRTFKWEEPSASVPAISEDTGAESTPADDQRTVRRAIEKRELRAPLLVDGLGTNAPEGQVLTVLPPSSDTQTADRRFKWARPSE